MYICICVCACFCVHICVVWYACGVCVRVHMCSCICTCACECNVHEGQKRASNAPRLELQVIVCWVLGAQSNSYANWCTLLTAELLSSPRHHDIEWLYLIRQEDKVGIGYKFSLRLTFPTIIDIFKTLLLMMINALYFYL